VRNEKGIGIAWLQLFHRTTRSITLTEQGKKFFNACEMIEQNCFEAVNHLKHDFKSMQGSLKITAPMQRENSFLRSQTG